MKALLRIWGLLSKYWQIFQEGTDIRSCVRNNFHSLIRCFEHSSSAIVHLDVRQFRFASISCRDYLHSSVHTTKRLCFFLSFSFVKFNVGYGCINLYTAPDVTRAIKSRRVDLAWYSCSVRMGEMMSVCEPQEKRPRAVLGVDGRIILKLIFNECCWEFTNYFHAPRGTDSDWLLWTLWWTPGFYQNAVTFFRSLAAIGL
jgi:hypothetical protein